MYVADRESLFPPPSVLEFCSVQCLAYRHALSSLLTAILGFRHVSALQFHFNLSCVFIFSVSPQEDGPRLVSFNMTFYKH